MEFHGVEDGVHGGGDGGHDEDGLLDHRGEFDAEESEEGDEEPAAHRAHHEADEAAHPGVHVLEDDGAAMDLHAQDGHDDGYQGVGAVFKDRPDEELCHVEAGEFDREDYHQRVDDRHVEDHGDGVSGGEFPFAGLVEAQGVQGHIHLHQHDGGAGAGLGEVGRAAVHQVRRVAKDQSDQGDADISVIGKHGAILQSFDLCRGDAADFPVDPGDESDEEHLPKAEEEDIQHGHVQLGDGDVVENEAGEDDEEGQLIERKEIQLELEIQQVADAHEDQKRQDVVGDDL